MKKKVFYLSWTFFFMVMGCLLTSLVSAAAPDWWKGSPQEYDQLVKNAEKEGKVIWYDSADEEGSAMIIEAFNKLYPKIKIEHMRAHGLDSRETILREIHSGATKMDVLEVSDELQTTYAELKLFRKVDWVNKFRVDPIMPSKDSTQVKVGGSLHGAAYNTNKASPQDVPKTWEEFLDPKWKGQKIGMDTRPKTWVGLWPAWGDKKMNDFLNKLGQQKPLYKRGTTALVQSLAAGEFPLMAGATFDSYNKVKMKGAPIEFYLPKPVVPVTFEREGVLSNAPNPNAATLFLGWLATAGQEIRDKATNGEGIPLPGYNTGGGRLVKSKDQLFIFDDEWLSKKSEFTEKATIALGMKK